MAPHPRQSLMPPFRGANILPRSQPAGRPSWRLTPGKALNYRFEAPTFCPRVCRWGARVGASPPAKPYATVTRRQLFVPEPAGRPPELAPHPRQSLMTPFRGANFLSQSPPVGRPSWRLTPGKALSYRFEAPTFCPGARRPSARVGASPPAKPYATVPRRQLFAPEPADGPPELAPHPRQSLMPPFRGANILPQSPPAVRPSWRLILGKALCHRSEAPTFCPGARRWTARVGASLPAKP